MSQQEFEPRRQRPDEEIYQPNYPYNWSDQAEQEGLPRDEPPGGYGVYRDQSGQSRYQRQPGQGQVPWWARPQRQQSGLSMFAVIVALVVLITLLMGGLGLVGLILGSIAHVVGVLLGALFALGIFVILFVLILIAIIRRALGRAFGAPWRYDRRSWRGTRRMARRSWRGPWY